MNVLSKKENGHAITEWIWDLWFSSFDVLSCSFAAQGLWINMLGIMTKSPIKGALIAGSKPLRDGKDIAKVIGKNPDEIDLLLKELGENHVYSKLLDGTIINRRMYSESQLRGKRASAGKIGAEKRWKKDGKSTASDTESYIANSNLFPPLSPHTPLSSLSCLSSSSLSSLKEGDIGGEIEKEFKDFWKAYPPDKGDNGEARKAFFKLRETESLETIIRAYDGYMDYLKDKRIKEHFEQQPMYASTFLRKSKWKRFLTYKSKPPL